MKRRAGSRGFTLIEVLVAMAVFAILSALAYGALNQTLASAEILGDRMDRLQAIQRAVRHLDRDFMLLNPRPVRSELGENYDAALQTNRLSGAAVELTRAGWSNPAAVPRGTLQRVAYRLEDDELIRYYWNVLDRTLSNEPVAVTLLEDVEAIQVRFLLNNGEWADEWPPQVFGAPPGLRQRPRAVEVVLRLVEEGEITRLIEVAP
ncbi:MAG: type II secretion system minor pseudopilin GspJ [Woeseiaceae bacterium]|nr:type II secretion system minor pseudopilin GspJ [Woeseiaceae bacterium]